MRLAPLVPLAFLFACGGGGSALFQNGAGGAGAGAGGGAASHACVPGQQRACACPGAAPDGTQVCASDGSTYGSCTGCPGGGSGGASSSSGSSSGSSGLASSSGTMSSSSGSSSSGGPCSGGSPTTDMDGDGYTPAQGDCNDCDANVNPGAVEVLNGIDDDCNGIIDDLPPPCDGALVLADTNPMSAAQAVELCKVANSANPKDWGVLSAQWELPDGSAVSSAVPSGTGTAATVLTNYPLGYGLLPAFGTNGHAQGGSTLLALSSGTARNPTDPGYVDVGQGFDKLYTCSVPTGYPRANPDCPGIVSGAPHDGVALEVTLRPPTNGHAFSFDFMFFASDYNQYLCSTYNDLFLAVLTPLPAGLTDGNVSFDSLGNNITVNTPLLQACSAATCSLGTNLLAGTGYDTNGGTGWLRTTTPTEPGQPFKIRWTIYDSGDGVFDSTTLVDNFQWIVTPPASPETAPIANPK